MNATQVYVKLTGDLDISTVPFMRRQLQNLSGPAIIDLAGVTYLSAAGLTELLRVARRSGPRTVILANGSRQIHRLLYLVHFNDLFVILDSVGDSPVERPSRWGRFAPEQYSLQ